MNGITPQDVEHATGGKYHVESLIGVGGMGAVYMATHRELGSKVAIKILPPEVRGSPGRMARFRREAAVSARLSHPHIVPVFEFETKDELAYLVMPYIEGATLEECVQDQGPFNLADLRILLGQVGDALAYAHERGIVHRDIKPANILLEHGSGRWLVTDFGVARVASVEEGTQLTQSEATIGTLAYMAPEQLGGARDVDGRADLYSLAAVAFETLTGQMPEREGNERAARQLLRRRPDLPVSLAKAMTRPLATARDDRPGSVREWLATVGPRRSRVGRRGVLVGTGVAAAALAFWFFSGRASAPPAQADPVVAVLPFSVSGQVPGLNLDSVLPQLIAWELRSLPDRQILQDSRVRAAILGRYGARVPGRDSLLSFAADRFEADEVVVGTASVEGQVLQIRAEVYTPSTGRRLDAADVEGPVGDLSNLVRRLVVETFATRIASAITGTGEPALPEGLPAVSAYFQGERAFRHGAFEEAASLFDSVIGMDSTYAPAHLKRMLSLVLQMRPSQIGPDIHLALDAAARHGDRLDPVASKVLDMYVLLLREGDVREAVVRARAIVDDHPDAVDAWFLLGALQARFPALAGVPRRDARFTLNQVVARDPVFAAAYGLLIQLAVLEDEGTDARAAIDGFLSLDSTSVRAEMVRVADTLLFEPLAAPRIIASLPDRPTELLEMMALGAGELAPPGGGRAVAARAVDALTPRAATARERAIFFRMRMAMLLGSGAYRRATTLLAQAATGGVPQSEIDRWTVLGAVAPVRLSPDTARVRQAAERLLNAEDEPVVSRWLAARWARRFEPTATARADRALRDATNGTPQPILARSLAEDLRALDLLAAGDSAGALAAWDAATGRYTLEAISLGLVASLWPLHWERLSALDAMRADSQIVAATLHFEQMTGFVDQVVWEPVLLARASAAVRLAERELAATAYRMLARTYADAEGAAASVRDSVAQLVETIRP